MGVRLSRFRSRSSSRRCRGPGELEPAAVEGVGAAVACAGVIGTPTHSSRRRCLRRRVEGGWSAPVAEAAWAIPVLPRIGRVMMADWPKLNSSAPSRALHPAGRAAAAAVRAPPTTRSNWPRRSPVVSGRIADPGVRSGSDGATSCASAAMWATCGIVDSGVGWPSGGTPCRKRGGTSRSWPDMYVAGPA
jgi:hypothetical protein